MSDCCIPQLLLEAYIFPRQKLGNGRWNNFGNSVIVARYERTKRALRGSD